MKLVVLSEGSGFDEPWVQKSTIQKKNRSEPEKENGTQRDAKWTRGIIYRNVAEAQSLRAVGKQRRMERKINNEGKRKVFEQIWLVDGIQPWRRWWSKKTMAMVIKLYAIVLYGAVEISVNYPLDIAPTCVLAAFSISMCWQNNPVNHFYTSDSTPRENWSGFPQLFQCYKRTERRFGSILVYFLTEHATTPNCS